MNKCFQTTCVHVWIVGIVCRVCTTVLLTKQPDRWRVVGMIPLATVSLLAATACPPASWPGWAGWIDSRSPFADAVYGREGALLVEFPRLDTLSAQLASMETWLELERSSKGNASCRMFDRVLDRLGERDSATRLWCDTNRVQGKAFLDEFYETVKTSPKKVRCVCSLEVTSAWEQCQKQDGCSEKAFVQWFNGHGGKRCVPSATPTHAISRHAVSHCGVAGGDRTVCVVEIVDWSE